MFRRLPFLLFLTSLIVWPAGSTWAREKKPTRSQPSRSPAKSPSRARKPSKTTPSKASKSVAAPTTPPAVATGALDLAAKGAIVVDAWSGDALFQKNADSRYYPASTTKIMTGLLVIESGSLDKPVEVTEEDARVGESSLSIHAGEQFSRRQMLYGLLLKSANDVAHALGRDNAGSIEAFAEKMNRRARELGCTNTHFANPHGLHHPEHYTTPRDLALITRAAMSQPLFRQIVATRQAPWDTPRGVIPLTNHNRLLGKFPGCIGVKTGYTIPAQQVLASAAFREGREAIAVVMHTNKPGIWEDSAKLLAYALEHQ